MSVRGPVDHIELAISGGAPPGTATKSGANRLHKLRRSKSMKIRSKSKNLYNLNNSRVASPISRPQTSRSTTSWLSSSSPGKAVGRGTRNGRNGRQGMAGRTENTSGHFHGFLPYRSSDNAAKVARRVNRIAARGQKRTIATPLIQDARVLEKRVS